MSLAVASVDAPYLDTVRLHALPPTSPAVGGVAPKGPVALRGPRERIAQTLTYEGLGMLVVTPAYQAATGAGLGDSVLLILAVAMTAALWCGSFNAVFDVVESWAAQRVASDRPHLVRLVQSSLRELAEVPVTASVILAFTGMDLQHAVMTDLALAAVYLVYGYAFFWIIDRVRPVR